MLGEIKYYFTIIIQTILFQHSVCLVNNKSPNRTYNLVFKPSGIKLKDVTKSYEETIFKKLFSSVPRRDRAIDNITIGFGCLDTNNEDINRDMKAGPTVLVGRSASGKSTLLRILSQTEEPDSGQICVKNSIVSAKPIIVDSKVDCYDTQKSVYRRIFDSFPMLSIDLQHKLNTEDQRLLKKDLIHEFSQRLGLFIDLHAVKPSDLTPSQVYLFGLICSSIESSITKDLCTNGTSNVIEIPYPVLLLDELLDKETYGVANKVGEGLLNLAQNGAIIVAATHRPEFLVNVASRVVTLSSGKILNIEYLNQ